MRRLSGIFFLATFLVLGGASADTLERIRDTGVFKIGYREDAAPFSFKNEIGEAAGYSVDLCRAVAVTVKQELSLPDISIDYVPVTAENRFDAVEEGRIDILCGATTATLSRRERVDFSVGTFIDGASVMFRVDGPGSFQDLQGKKIAVRGGTTTEDGLRATLKRLSLDARVVPVAMHGEGLRMLEAGEISAYFGDRAILLFLAARSEHGDLLRISQDYFSYEPYALAMARGDDDFRLLVDRTLSRLYRSGDIAKIFVNAFGAAEPTEILEVLYLVNALPE